MKKLRYYMLALVLLSLILVGCGSNEKVVDDTSVENVAALNTDQNVMLFSTLSSASILGSSQMSNLATNINAPLPTFLTEKVEEEVEIDMEKANAYLLMMENILADGGPIISSESASDRDGYDTMMVVTVKDLAGNTSTYTIYYSVLAEIIEEDSDEKSDGDVDTSSLEDTESAEPVRFGDDRTDEDDKKDREAKEHFKNHRYDDDDEKEMEYQINALAVIDGVEYEVKGSKEVEVDDNETEVEIEFVVKLDENNYVKIKQEVEDDESEYKYTVYKDGRKQTSMSFESEKEDGNIVVKLTTDEAGYKETYKFIKGEEKTIIKYDGNGYSYTLFVTSILDSETDELVYEYKVKEKEYDWEYRKEHKHHSK